MSACQSFHCAIQDVSVRIPYGLWKWLGGQSYMSTDRRLFAEAVSRWVHSHIFVNVLNVNCYLNRIIWQIITSKLYTNDVLLYCFTGSTAYPCKSLPLAPGRYHESCLSGYCDIEMNSCEDGPPSALLRTSRGYYLKINYWLIAISMISVMFSLKIQYAGWCHAYFLKFCLFYKKFSL